MRRRTFWLGGFSATFLLGAALLSAALAGDPTNETSESPSQSLQEDQFLKQWLLLGPASLTPNGDLEEEAWQKKAFNEDPFAESGGEAKLSPHAGQEQAIDGQKLEWKIVASTADTLDLAQHLGPREFAVAYAYTEVKSPDERKTLLAVGSDDAVKVWLNGELIHENWIGRPLRVDDDLMSATLQKGTNRLLVKVQNQRGAWSMAVRPLSESKAGARLRRAAAEGSLANVRKLLDLGIPANTKNDSGLTALHIARVQGQPKVAKLLEEHGADAKAPMPPLEAMADQLLSTLVQGESSGVAALVSRGGEILYQKGFGYASLEHLAPVTLETKFRIGSISKQFTASAILKLQEQGKLSVEDKLSKYVSDFPRGDEVTLVHLLTHTSGIHSYTSKPDFFATARLGITDSEMIAWIKADPYDFDPGARFLYNNSGYWLLGHIVEKVSGKSLDAFLKAEFFEPLGMKSTGVHNPNDVLRHEAFGYSYEGGKFVKALNWDMSRAGGAGALYSTVGDLQRWNEAIFGGQVLKPESLKAAFTPAVLPGEDPNKDSGYGFGWMVGKRRGLEIVEHGGGLQGFLSHLTRYPEHDLTVVVLENAASPPPGMVPSELAHQLAAFCLWQDMKPEDEKPAEVEVDEKTLEKYVGQYDYTAAILTVTRRGKQLFAQLTGQPAFEIYPKSETEFFWKVVQAEVKFVTNDEGKVTKAIHRQSGQTINAARIEPRKLIKLSQETIDEYVGKYDYGGKVAILTVTREGDRIFAQLTGQPKFELLAQAKDELYWKDVNAQVRFERDKDGKVIKAIHQQAGQKIEAPRLE